MAVQYFKGDSREKKFYNCGLEIMDNLSMQKDMFYDDAFETADLGDLIKEDLRSPLANAISPTIFRSSFKEIFDAFVVAGTFESYLTVFTKIFGDDVEVDFTVPSPGKLLIDIVASGLEESPFIERHIVSNVYLFEEVVDYVDDNIVFQTVKGFQSQYELEQMLFEMVPDGIYTEITLTLGEG